MYCVSLTSVNYHRNSDIWHEPPNMERTSKYYQEKIVSKYTYKLLV